MAAPITDERCLRRPQLLRQVGDLVVLLLESHSDMI